MNSRAGSLLRLFGVVVALACTAGGARAQGTDSPHGTLTEACASCHRPEAWKPAKIAPSFRHAPGKFPLEGAHANATCRSCHVSLEFNKAPSGCASCHNDVHNGELGTTCARCHTPRGFTDLARMRTAHEATRFPLRGAHAASACSACHAPAQPGQMRFAGRPTTCVSCHADRYRATTAPDHQAAQFSQDCTSCHNVSTWSGAKFDHGTTRFALDGGHRAVACSSCHGDKVYVGKPMACVACHQADFTRTTNPPHVASGFATTCTTCHTTAAWGTGAFDHARTQFPLNGAHRTVACTSCHADGVYHGKPTTCISCHQQNYNTAALPPHSSAAFSTVCTTCHTEAAWRPASFDHSRTAYPLTGAHVTATCADCHADRVYRGKPSACVSCHQSDYDKSVTPPHKAGGFPTTCATCHTTSAWKGAPFDHSTTQFALTGAHRSLSCDNCHADHVYKGKPTACVACHQSTFDNTRTPPHKSGGFPTTCGTCHSTTAWTGAPFNHATTQFPLTGAHAPVACTSCHGDGVYAGKSTACISCHQQKYNSALLPPHSSLGFPTVCTTCHTTIAWQPASFDHATTQFPLTGAHRAASCADCHADKVYKGKPTACASCHQANYAATKTPPHAASGFPTTCETCHTTTAWTGSAFNHSTTSFPLTGAHVTTLCASCHGDGVYKGKPTACVSCHQQKYNTALFPPHTSLGFSTVCTTCHTTVAWQPASFNHATTQFPLTGAHLAASCLDCHADKVYQGKSTACASCHQTTYNTTTNPPHSAAGFPTTCQTCHTTTKWLGATFNHATTRFPLTGSHTTLACSSCHGDGVYRGKPLVCSGCHLTKYSATTNPNHAAASFPTTCESCHNTTTWLGATFNHDASFFPIYSGAHQGRWTTCAQCHTSPTNFAVFTCTTCHTKSTTDSKHQGKSGYVYASPNCYACHPRGRAG